MSAGTEGTGDLETQISQWRAYMDRPRAIRVCDLDELEDHLRDQINELRNAGLNPDEAFLVAVKRMRNFDPLSRELAREHSDRFWKNLVLAPETDDQPGGAVKHEFFAMIGFAIAAALALKVPAIFGLEFSSDNSGFYQRNLSLFVLPLLAGYLAWKRRLEMTCLRLLAPPFVAAAVFANAFPFVVGGATEVLTALHLPILLWLVVGIAYTGGDWRSDLTRMDYVRFTGEWFIYYVLIALGGGVLTVFTVGIFDAIGLDLVRFTEAWLLPCGALSTVIVAAWLVEAKQSVVENMAPVLTRVFTPLFAVMLLALLVAVVWTRAGIDVDRDVLILFDLLLVLVLGLLLYAISARDPEAPPDLFDRLQLLMVVGALATDAFALISISSRLNEFGFSANRAAALGLNLILLANLTWAAWLYVSFLRRLRPFTALERWQTAYLPVYAIWAATVVVVFPPVFDFA